MVLAQPVLEVAALDEVLSCCSGTVFRLVEPACLERDRFTTQVIFDTIHIEMKSR